MSMGHVSRETEDMLLHYVELLLKWTQRINLIAPSTEKDVWARHILDCRDAVGHVAGVSGRWADLGSGGGLPGLVAAILCRDQLDGCTLVESDQRKCVFLRTVVRELALNVTVENRRIEDGTLDAPSLISARALAPLSRLLDLTSAHHDGNCTFLFMKGRNWKHEVEEAGDRFRFTLEVHPGLADTGGTTLLLSDIKRRSEVHG